jgi:hypothetical protein
MVDRRHAEQKPDGNENQIGKQDVVQWKRHVFVIPAQAGIYKNIIKLFKIRNGSPPLSGRR